MFARPILFVLLALTAGVAAEVLAQDTTRDQLLHYSLQVDIDEEARTQLQASEAELARGDVLTAVSRWRALLDSPRTGGLVPFRGASVSTATAIEAIVRTLPESVRVEYLRITEPIATRALAAATAKDDMPALWSVADRFPGTNAGTDAWVNLAELSFDAGRFADCRLAVDRWFDAAFDPKSAVIAQPRMAAWRRLSLLALGDAVSEDAKWNEFSAVIPPELRQAVASAETLRPIPAPDAGRATQGSLQDVTEVLPSEEVVWTVPLSSGSDRNWASLHADFEDLAHPLLLVGQPVVTPNGIVVSGIGHRLIDPATGEVKWTVGSGVESSATRRDALEGFRRALGESIAGRSTIVGERLFEVGSLLNGRRQDAFANQIDALALADGRTLKSIPRGTALGPPVSGHGQLYAVIQLEQRVVVAAFDLQTLEPRWQTRLGDAGLDLMMDHRRQWMPALLDASGDVVTCATGNGAVAAIDPRSGRVRWIHRREREDWRNAGPPQMTAVASSPRFRMWTGWREPVLKVIGDVVIWAGPEANVLMGLGRETGEMRWSLPRGDGLAVVTAGDAALIVSQEDIRRVDPTTGATLWSSAIALPSGVGFAAGAWYVQPLRSGGTVALRLSDGATTRSVALATEVMDEPRGPLEELRSATWSPDGVLVQSPLSISLHRTVASVRESTPRRTTAPEWLAAAGRLDDAAKALNESDGGAEIRRQRLQLIERETAEHQFHLTARPFERLPEESIGREVEEHVAGFLLDARPETAVELLAGVSLEELASIWVESNRKPYVRLRGDVLAASTILGRPADTESSASIAISPAGRARLENLLKRVATVRPEDVPGILGLLSRSDWGASKILERQQSASGHRGDTRDLARLRLKLLALESAGGDLGARAAQLGQSLRPATTDLTAWPEGEPVISERKWNSLIGQWPVQFTPLDNSELKGLSIDVLLTGFNRRTPGMGVHFAGCGQGRPWEINLPKTDRSLGQSADYRQGIGIGPLVVMQTSTGLHGLLPFNAAGEREATRLWDVAWIDMWGNVATHSVSYLPRLSDVAPGRHPLDLDEFGRPLTQVGPVTASYFCYREFGRLVCCDTATGRRRWDRTLFGPGDTAVGDETAVIVVSPRNRVLEILNPFDGEVLGARSIDFPARHWRTAIETTALLRSGARDENVTPETRSEEASAMMAVDLETGQRKWTQSLEPAAVEFVVGRRLVGAVDAESIRFFNPKDGAEKKQIAIATPAEIADVHAVDDPFTLMVCVFRRPAVEQLRPPLQLLGNRRNPYANGMVYGFDPETLELKWSIPLERSVFPLDQPRDIPLLVIHDATVAGEPEVREDRIRCFDKRTGRQVGKDLRGELVGSTGIVIGRSQRDGWVDVRTSRGVFRFDFGEVR